MCLQLLLDLSAVHTVTNCLSQTNFSGRKWRHTSAIEAPMRGDPASPERMACFLPSRTPPLLFAGGGDCFCCERPAGADLSTEPWLSRVIVSFLLNRIRAQRCGGFSPPVKRAAGGRQPDRRCSEPGSPEELVKGGY